MITDHPEACPDCGDATEENIAGEWRCVECDAFIDRMLRGQREDAVAEGRA
jgi:ribosomal protein L37AE/L43A